MEKTLTGIIPLDFALLSRNHESIWQVLGLLVFQQLVEWMCLATIHINFVLDRQPISVKDIAESE